MTSRRNGEAGVQARQRSAIAALESAYRATLPCPFGVLRELAPYRTLDEDHDIIFESRKRLKQQIELDVEENEEKEESNLVEEEPGPEPEPLQEDETEHDAKRRKSTDTPRAARPKPAAPSSRELRNLLPDKKRKWHGAFQDPRQEELYEGLDNVLTQLKNYHEHSYPFLVKVRASDAPDYYDIITNPMDLGTMNKKLNRSEYKSKQQFVDDIDLIVNNCRTYNVDPESAIFVKHADALEKKAKQILKNVKEVDLSQPGPEPLLLGDSGSSSGGGGGGGRTSDGGSGAPQLAGLDSRDADERSQLEDDTEESAAGGAGRTPKSAAKKSKSKGGKAGSKQQRKSIAGRSSAAASVADDDADETSGPESAAPSEAGDRILDKDESDLALDDASEAGGRLRYLRHRLAQVAMPFGEREAIVRSPELMLATVADAAGAAARLAALKSEISSPMSSVKSEPDAAMTPAGTASEVDASEEVVSEALMLAASIPEVVPPTRCNLAPGSPLAVLAAAPEPMASDVLQVLLERTVLATLDRLDCSAVESGALDVLMDSFGDYLTRLGRLLTINRDLFSRNLYATNESVAAFDLASSNDVTGAASPSLLPLVPRRAFGSYQDILDSVLQDLGAHDGLFSIRTLLRKYQPPDHDNKKP